MQVTWGASFWLDGGLHIVRLELSVSISIRSMPAHELTMSAHPDSSSAQQEVTEYIHVLNSSPWTEISGSLPIISMKKLAYDGYNWGVT